MDCSILGLIVGLLVMEPTTFFRSKPRWNFPVVTRRRSASALLNMGGVPFKTSGRYRNYEEIRRARREKSIGLVSRNSQRKNKVGECLTDQSRAF